MGDGRTDSKRWQPERRLSITEQRNYWRNQYLQLKSERDYQVQQNIKLAETIAKREQELSQYRRAFGPIGFNIPGDQE